MAVKITKPSINIREKLSELDKPAGIAGEAMLRAETPQEQFNLIGAGRKNLIINGDMQVWQRGIAGVPSSLSYVSVDRFWCYIPNRTSGSLDRSDDVPEGQGFTWSLHQNTNAAGSIGYAVELPVVGKTILKSNTDYTFSFWAKGASQDEVGVYIRYRDSKGSGANQVDLMPNTTLVFTDNKWKRYTITLNTALIEPASTSTQIAIEFGGVNPDTKITGVQFEEGKVATPFEHRSYGEELALCQRYYWHWQGTEAYSEFCIVAPYDSINAIGVITTPVTMRINPTCYWGGSWQWAGNSSQPVTAISFQFKTYNSTRIKITSTNLPIDGAVRLRANNNYDAYIAFDAEL